VLPSCLLLVACMGGGGRPVVSATAPAGGAPASPLEGRWLLAGVEAQGEQRDGTGELTFDRFNTITIRAELQPGQPGVTAPRTVLVAFRAKASVTSDAITYLGVEPQAPREQMIPLATDQTPGATTRSTATRCACGRPTRTSSRWRR
jgi:hypothetical protein